MKAKIIIDIDGDFEGELTDREVEEIIKTVVRDGAEVNSCSGKVELLEIIEN